ncbi:MAG: DUF1622 domain-containing protein [Hymenobacteraceae bacterium]|nr:DUF1622 domain-containing protein [Hymenobacteraceae bacterium]MDX5395916.1 DUF1622 domain-containing protein [Hymenobacteraceae bacterium]MDX5442685.1 DUF1622 domain-containing protein [Hymenobacteraceae bacterium]MDX5511973.1 DUF1622 domain-containing protein [Hymenobacteraceae bacterium]
MEEIVKEVTLHLAWLVELMSALIIGYAAIRACISYARSIFQSPRKGKELIPKDAIRLSLGRTLALSLELLLGADILKTAVSPTWNDIGQLAAIAILRTALNYFLEKELRQVESRKLEMPTPEEKTDI